MPICYADAVVGVIIASDSNKSRSLACIASSPLAFSTMRSNNGGGGGRFDLLSPFRRKARYDVEHFRSLYATLLELIAPPPPLPPPSLSLQRPNAADAGVENDEEREHQQQPPAEGSSQEAAGPTEPNPDLDSDDPCRYSSDGKARLRIRRRQPAFPSPSKKPYSLTEQSAWRVLAATPNPFKEGNCADTALAVRDNESVAVLAAARAKERKVVDTILQIGETITNASDEEEVWAYFCDKNILSLLVDMAKAKPPPPKQDSEKDEFGTQFCGVVFTPAIKAQVLQTIIAILSNADGDDTSLYFLLSSNHINDTVNFLAPLHQWTGHALDTMVPHFCVLLKGLSKRLLKKPQLFQFFVDTNHHFPLLHSAIHVLTSTFSQSDPFVYEAACSVVLNLCQIPSEGIRSAIGDAVVDQEVLLSHLCQRLTANYRHIARLTVGISSGDPKRSKAIGRELAGLQELFQLINDVLWCGIRQLNVRFCEHLLRVLFQNVLPGLLLGGNADFGADASTTSSSDKAGGSEIPPNDPQICEGEAHCLASLVFLNQLFVTLEYAPLLKMCSVAIFHPLSTTHESEEGDSSRSGQESDNYAFQSALNALLNDSTTTNNIQTSTNPYRAVLHAMIKGDLGYRSFVPAAMILQGLLDSDLDVSFLSALRVVDLVDPENSEGTPPQSSEFEDAIGHFLTRNHRASETASFALECAGALILSFLSHLIVAWSSNGTNFEHFHDHFITSSLVMAIATARSQYAAKAKTMSRAAELSGIFIELMELELSRRYDAVPGENDSKVFVCNLNASDCHNFHCDPEILVRALRETGSNEVEEAKFTIRALLYFRSLGRVVEELHQNLNSCIGPNSIGPRWTEDTTFFEVRTTEIMEDDYITLVGREDRPQLGTDLDIRGRTFFYFSPSLPDINLSHSSSSDRKRRLAQELKRMAMPGQQEELLLVLDPTDLFVLKPNLSDGACNRGVILCHAPIGAVIAAVPEKELLHIAVRQTEESFFVKNGNMSLRFDSVGTSRIAEQYLGR